MSGQQLRDDFAELGYVLLRNLLDPTEVAELARGIHAAAEDDPGDNPLSLGTMRFASNLYRRNESVRRFASSARVVELLTSVGAPDLWLRWDQAVWKHHGAPAFPWHQDNGYTLLDTTHLQLWVALTPMHSGNGGLMLCPGGHRRLLPHRHVGHHVEADVPGPTIEVDAAAGDVILFSSYLPHSTSPNTSGEPRLAYVAEYLPLSEADASVPPPRLVVAEHGRPVARWDPTPAS